GAHRLDLALGGGGRGGGERGRGALHHRPSPQPMSQCLEPPRAARRGLTVLPEAGAGDEAASPHHDRPEEHPLHPDWRWQLRHRISTLDEIERLLPLTSEERAAMVSAPSHFRVGITPYYF